MNKNNFTEQELNEYKNYFINKFFVYTYFINYNSQNELKQEWNNYNFIEHTQSIMSLVKATEKERELCDESVLWWYKSLKIVNVEFLDDEVIIYCENIYDDLSRCDDGIYDGPVEWSRTITYDEMIKLKNPQKIITRKYETEDEDKFYVFIAPDKDFKFKI